MKYDQCIYQCIYVREVSKMKDVFMLERSKMNKMNTQCIYVREVSKMKDDQCIYVREVSKMNQMNKYLCQRDM